jgi:hypothetical protein
MNTDPEQVIGDKRLLAMYRYWEDKRGDRPMPARTDIDPAEIPRLLSIIMLVDISADGEYRYRLVGTEIVRWIGHDITGSTFSEALPVGPYGEYITGLVREVITSGRPLFSEGAFLVEGRIDRQVRRLALPLSTDGKTVDMILAGQTVVASPKDALMETYPPDLPFSERQRIFLE